MSSFRYFAPLLVTFLKYYVSSIHSESVATTTLQCMHIGIEIWIIDVWGIRFWLEYVKDGVAMDVFLILIDISFKKIYDSFGIETGAVPCS